MTKSADLQRLASLSDCVFAVAMTLLAFSVRIPDQGVDPAKLPGELTRMWNESFGLVLSFCDRSNVLGSGIFACCVRLVVRLLA
jgi:uncharacterized membrane protein